MRKVNYPFAFPNTSLTILKRYKELRFSRGALSPSLLPRFLAVLTFLDRVDTMTYPTTEQVEKARRASLAGFFIQNGFEAELTRNELHVKGYGVYT